MIEMNGEKNEVKLDYEGMYKQLSKEKRSYKKQLNSVILSCTNLEFIINQLIKIKIEKTQSPILKDWTKRVYAPVGSKLRYLRFADLIDEDLYHNLTILFRIRNRFAHKLFLTSKESAPEFAVLRDARLKDKFLGDLPNNSIKFELIMSTCFVELMNISKKLDPNSVTELELVGDIIPIEE